MVILLGISGLFIAKFGWSLSCENGHHVANRRSSCWLLAVGPITPFPHLLRSETNTGKRERKAQGL